MDVPTSSDSPLNEYMQQLIMVEKCLETVGEEQRSDLLDLKRNLTEAISLLQGTSNASTSKSAAEEKQIPQSDDEFSRFQREIEQLSNDSDQTTPENKSPTPEDDPHGELCKVLASMEGNKCRAPFTQSWGGKSFHNAIVFSTDGEEQDAEELKDFEVKVMFCNPVCYKMKPCPFFLDGFCKFDDDCCRFSHGYSVKFVDLEEYALPDYSNVQRDSRCLAKYKDDLWYPAVVENCLENQQYFVKYEKFGTTNTLDAHDIYPIDGISDSDSESSDSEDSDEAYDISKYEEETQKEPVFKVEIGTSALGSWEQHTKGIGSKLMTKMGYVWGQGLGKHSDGRIEPVEAFVLPKGKSLDKCAELRERSGPTSVEDKFNATKIEEEHRVKNMQNNGNPQNTVFDFLNKSVFKNYDKHQDLRKRHLSPSSSEKRKSNTSLNLEAFTVGEDIKKAKKEITKLKQFLTRNTDRNETACARVRQKMTAQNSLLQRLEAKECKIKNELDIQKNHKKSTVF